ncbi:MAG: hypothetical protein HY279_02490 [Nitrospinae bacterium]|nr:hypothetical protein [Nitrospinota bacterium]
MKKLSLFGFIIITFLINWHQAIANPCAYEVFSGRHIYSGAPQKDIFINEESIRAVFYTRLVKLDVGAFNEVEKLIYEIEYTFSNAGSEKELIIGFPVGRMRKDIIEDFKVIDMGTGQVYKNEKDSFVNELTLKGSDLRACEAGFYIGPEGMKTESESLPEDIESRLQKKELDKNNLHKHPLKADIDWYIWKQPFKGEGKTKIRVTYTIKPESDSCRFHYILSTARYWGDGTIKNLTIKATFKGKLKHPAKNFKGPTGIPKNYKYNRKKQEMTWEFKEFTPEEDLEFILYPDC